MKARAFFLPLAVAMAAVILYTAATIDAHRLTGRPKTVEAKLKLAKRQVAHDRRELQAVRTRHWTLLSPIPAAAVVHRWWLARDVRYVRQLDRQVDAVSGPSWLVNAFLCIHRGEGSWTDSGDPYWGGLQMDRSFMATYGSWAIRRYGGFANVWPPAVQIQVAIAAYNSGRGFYPWPTTARRCGLI